MSRVLVPGIVLMSLGTLYLLSIGRRKSERFEYAAAMFFLELGLMFVVGATIDLGSFQLPVTMGFGLGLLWTATLWWRLFKRFRHTAGGKLP